VSTGNVMTREQIDATVREVLGTAFERPIPPGEDLSPLTEARWDSVKHIDILFMLEEALGITFAEEELSELKSARSLVDRAAAHLGVG
jgi:acyl carrier protein